MAPDGPHFDSAAALEGGLTAAVVDMEMYPRSLENALAALADWNWTFRAADTRLVKVESPADFDRAASDGKLAVVLACQDAAILGPSTGSVSTYNLQNLGLLYELGLRVLQITHNEQNALGGSFRERRDSGLSRLGESVVAEMNHLGVLIDLSHCGPTTTLETLKASKRPCLITHAGCRALQASARNKADEEIRAVAETGGFFGVFAMSLWLTDRPTTSLEDLLDHVDHAVRVAGVEHVGFGSDGPVTAREDLGAELTGMREYARRNLGLPGAERIPDHVAIPELNTPHRLEVIGEGLRRRGYGSAAIDGILGGNLMRVLRDGLVAAG